jgi:hypothetical protein
MDLTDAKWFKSSYSNNGGECVEVAPTFSDIVPVRDSKDPDGGALLFPAPAWHAFVAGVRADGLSAI